jgi:hypothetical protein
MGSSWLLPMPLIRRLECALQVAGDTEAGEGQRFVDSFAE